MVLLPDAAGPSIAMMDGVNLLCPRPSLQLMHFPFAQLTPPAIGCSRVEQRYGRLALDFNGLDNSRHLLLLLSKHLEPFRSFWLPFYIFRQLGQVVQTLKAEMLQELERRRVQNRAPDGFHSPHLLNQAAREQ